jgi:DNA-binding IscR family transcriptional regulator
MLDSFEKLEITIALHRVATPMSVSELSTNLHLSSQIVERGLDELARAGAVHLADGTARLTLPAQDLPAMDEIVALYDEDRLLVVRTLTEISMDRIRGMAARAFADAFQLRRKNQGGGDG